jgi:hypothetical protein
MLQHFIVFYNLVRFKVRSLLFQTLADKKTSCFEVMNGIANLEDQIQVRKNILTKVRYFTIMLT